MKTSTGLILLGGGLIAAYFLFKDKGGIPGVIGGALSSLPGFALQAAGAAPETIKETGVVGGAGDIIYNLTMGGDLREEATKPGGKYYEAAKKEIPLVTGITPTSKQIVPRAVAMGASEQIHDLTFPGALLAAPVTIGAGLGAITQQRKYYAALPTPEAKEKALVQEYTQRQEWIRGHPLESMVGFPAGIIHAVTTPVPQTDFFSTLARGWGRIFG